MALFNPSRRANRMTVGTAFVLMQMSDEPVIFGCAEVVAKRLCRVTAGAPACAIETKSPNGHPQFHLTEYGQEVKKCLEKWVCLSVK